jgi:hypothetical protein
VLSIEPQEPGKGFEFVDAIKGGVVPREFIPRSRRAIETRCRTACWPAIPVVDVKVTLTFGSYHEVDSNENAFKMAASIGFKDGCRKASPVILEPMMAVEVETPEDYAGSVMGDLSSRRGMVQGMDDMPGGGKIIKAEFRCRRCSATPPRCARCRKAAPRTRWSSSTTPRRPRTWPTRSSRRVASKFFRSVFGDTPPAASGWRIS